MAYLDCTGVWPKRRRAAKSRLNPLIDKHLAHATALRQMALADAVLRHAEAQAAAADAVKILQIGESARFAHGYAPEGPMACGGGAAMTLQSQAKGGEVETMNKKSIAPQVPVLYPPQAAAVFITQAKRNVLREFNWGSTVPKLHAFKRGLMSLSLFWRRLTILAGEIRTQVMVEIDKNPLAVRQGAATIMCLAAAAVAMPVISHRAAEQREGAEWAATSTAFQAELQQQLAASEPNARVELTAFRTDDGLRARGNASLFESADARAMMVQAVLRGPTAPAETNEQAEAAIDARQHACLSQAIYYEARGESQRGQVAVAEVIMNRVRSRAYPNSICGVVYQGSHRVTGCQFTFTCDGSLNHRPRGRAWDRAQRVATAVMSGYTRPITGGATHYHTHAVNPVWNSGLVETTNVGDHVFYRFPRASERAYYQEALARRMGSRGRRGGGEALIAADPAVPADETVDVNAAAAPTINGETIDTAPARVEDVDATGEEVAT